VNQPSPELAAAFRQLRENGGSADLSERVKLRLIGADRVRYLNGQVTCDVRRIAVGQSIPGCLLSAKGKLAADIYITATEHALFIDADAELREALLARIERYIIADDVTVEDVTDEYRLVHLFGPAASAPADFGDGVLVAKAERLGKPGLDLLIPAGAWAKVAERLPCSHIDPRLLEALRIEAGIPRWGTELGENTLPPEAGLDRTHIDYHKGCYVGQEVISRLKSVGHVNRQLTGFSAPAGESLTAGMRLFSRSDPTREVGALTSATWSFTLERPIALGYLKRGVPPGDLLSRALDDAGAETALTVHELPFSL
jgi:folate-binding protein YgfZ